MVTLKLLALAGLMRRSDIASVTNKNRSAPPRATLRMSSQALSPSQVRLRASYRNLTLWTLQGWLSMFFLAAGWAYGSATGSVKTHRDIVRMMSEAMADLSYYLVLAFAAAHFVAMFNWSNLGLIVAVKGAGVISGTELPMAVLLVLVVLMTTLINLFIGSASAKWALLAPVLVPMLMLLGVSPEMEEAYVFDFIQTFAPTLTREVVAQALSRPAPA